MYTDSTTIDGQIALDLLHSSNKYQLLDLSKACVSFLESSISGDTVCGLFSRALEFQEHRLIERCQVFIRENVFILDSPNVVSSLSEEALTMIVKDGEIGIDEVVSLIFCSDGCRCQCFVFVCVGRITNGHYTAQATAMEVSFGNIFTSPYGNAITI